MPVTYPKSLCLFNFKPLFIFLNAKDPAIIFAALFSAVHLANLL